MQFLRRSASNSRSDIIPATGVPDHRVSKKQENEGVNNVRILYVKPTLKRGHARSTHEVKYVDISNCNGNAKGCRAFPLGNGVYCSMPSKQLSTAHPTGLACHSVRASPPWTSCSPRGGCSSAGTNVLTKLQGV